MALSDKPKADAVIPDSTYRLQLNKHFNFERVAACISYLHRLGISHCYLSPFLKARQGSSHGYDIVDHNTLNPEIGETEDFDTLISRLQQHGMGLIADIVPNHMGIMGADNDWWLDVLENGPSSSHASFFDIDWHPVKKVLENKILIPVLGDHYGNILEKQELKLSFDSERGEFSVYYYEHRFPIDPQTYPLILSSQHERLHEYFEADDPVLHEYQTLDNSFGKLPAYTEITPESIDERTRDKEVFKKQLARLCLENARLTLFIRSRITEINRHPEDCGELHALLERQAYRLAYWHVAGDEINYRRFFDINDLAGLRVEDAEVFDASHRLVLSLVEQGKIQGLRIDHADGLHDPVAYYRRLQSENMSRSDKDCASKIAPLYIVAEKIVANYEYLNSDWPIHGTTGYEFAAIANGLFIDMTAEKALTRTYTRFVGHKRDFDEILYQAKKHVMETSLASELNMLAIQLSRIAEANAKTRDYTLNALHDALKETVSCFPVYRTYINSLNVRKEDSQYIDWAVQQGRQRSRASDLTIFGFIHDVLLLKTGDSTVSSNDLLKFVMRFQQYTSPVMAKGTEDTALYEYNRLVSLNEVGSDPRHFGNSCNAFHHFNQERARKWPHSLLCLSSHDTKRSADTRARINVLSEISQQWHEAVFRWHRINRIRKDKSEAVIARNDEYLFYQTLVGTFPLGELNASNLSAYRERVENYMLKAVREAKQLTSWTNPNTDYEQAVSLFVKRCLNEAHTAPFLQDFLEFEHKIRSAGLFNALSQTLLLLTSPGVPDNYQGSENWQFSLVDPDNRRPVDFNRLGNTLNELDSETNRGRHDLLKTLLETIEDGRIKLFVVAQTLRFRRQYSDLFQNSDYIKLDCNGTQADHIVAYARKTQDRWALIIVPRLTTSLLDSKTQRFRPKIWQDTCLELPQDSPSRFYDMFSRNALTANDVNGNHLLNLDEVFECFPFALLTNLAPD
ncbi:MAG: malto-oligosyltrehalose synthase [Methylomicrobium sp.]|nr:malto-oligosyltrehalose synthase [Methylomicrobium sp.]